MRDILCYTMGQHYFIIGQKKHFLFGCVALFYRLLYLFGCIMCSQSKAITYCINILIHLDAFVQDKLELTCVHDSSIAELMRGIRSQFSNLVPGLPERELTAMTLGLAHRLVTFPDGAFFLTNNTCICFMCLVESIRITNMNRLNKKNL